MRLSRARDPPGPAKSWPSARVFLILRINQYNSGDHFSLSHEPQQTIMLIVSSGVLNWETPPKSKSVVV